MQCTESCANPAVASCICSFPLPLLCEEHLKHHSDTFQMTHFHLPLYARDRVTSKAIRRTWKSRLFDFGVNRFMATYDLLAVSDAYNAELKQMKKERESTESERAKLAEEVESLKRKVQQLSANSMCLQTELSAATSQVSRLKSENEQYNQTLYMSLIIEEESGVRKSLFLRPCETVNSLKASICKGEKRLFLGGKELQGNLTLAMCGVVSGTVLQLKHAFQIFVRHYTGRIIVLLVSSEDTIKSIKEKITEREGLGEEIQRLTHGGKTLTDSRTLHEYGITKDTQLDLGLRNMSTRLLVIVVLSSRHELPIEIDYGETVGFLKHRIQQLMNMSDNNLQLKYRNMDLQNDCLLKEYGVINGSRLELITQLCLLHVVTAMGQVLSFAVPRMRTIAEVKKLLFNRLGMPPEEQSLRYRGSELKDDERVFDLDLMENLCLERVN